MSWGLIDRFESAFIIKMGLRGNRSKAIKMTFGIKKKHCNNIGGKSLTITNKPTNHKYN